MAAVRHFGFVDKFWEDPQRVLLGCLYHYAKFGWNRFSHAIGYKSLNNMRVWLENAYSRHLWGVLGVKIGDNVNVLHFYPSFNAITHN